MIRGKHYQFLPNFNTLQTSVPKVTGKPCSLSLSVQCVLIVEHILVSCPYWAHSLNLVECNQCEAVATELSQTETELQKPRCEPDQPGWTWNRRLMELLWLARSWVASLSPTTNHGAELLRGYTSRNHSRRRRRRGNQMPFEWCSQLQQSELKPHRKWQEAEDGSDLWRKLATVPGQWGGGWNESCRRRMEGKEMEKSGIASVIKDSISYNITTLQ